MVYLRAHQKTQQEDGMYPFTDLCGPEPAGGAGPAYSVILVASSKVSLPSNGKTLFDALSHVCERDAYW